MLRFYVLRRDSIYFSNAIRQLTLILLTKFGVDYDYLRANNCKIFM